jgi:hypothetical protein
MQEEASEELLAGECHLPFLVAVGIVLPAEGDLVILEGEQTMIGNGNVTSVASQVAEHALGSTERRFGINDPILREEGSEEGSERLGVTQRLQTAGEDQLALAEALLQAGHELAPEDTAKHFDWDQEGIARMNPAGVIG